MIQFAWGYFFLLLPLPWLAYRFFLPCEWSENAALKVPDFEDFAIFEGTASLSLFKRLPILPFFVWFALLTAAARPQWLGEMIEIPQTGRDLMLAVDLSGSMQMQDFERSGQVVDRLTALKWIASDFIDRRKGDRVGLILFGTHAYLQTPLTFDLSTVKQLLNEAAVGLAGNETAIGDAIGLAVKQMRQSPANARVLILLTDGNSNAGALSPEKAAEIASHVNLKVHTVAIGAKEMIVQTLFGRQKVNPSADIDEKSLQLVAEKTGGQYFRAYNTEELANIYQHIDRLEAIERNSLFFREIEELYLYPLMAALSLALILLSWKWRII